MDNPGFGSESDVQKNEMDDKRFEFLKNLFAGIVEYFWGCANFRKI